MVQTCDFGYLVWTLIDNGATKCFILTSTVVPLGLSIVHNYTFLQLGDVQKALSKGKVLDVPIVFASVMTHMDLTIILLPHEADVILVPIGSE